MQSHYVYSLREIIRWLGGICKAIHSLEIGVQQALRMFQDKLMDDGERQHQPKRRPRTVHLLSQLAIQESMPVDHATTWLTWWLDIPLVVFCFRKGN